MRFRHTDGEGYIKNDNRESGGLLFEDGILGCSHCSAAIHRMQEIEKPKSGLSLRAKCWHCDGYLCPECGFATWMHGHRNLGHWRTWPQGMWIQRAVDEAYHSLKSGD